MKPGSRGARQPKRSKVVHQIAHTHAQSTRHTQKSVKTDPLFATFDLADVNWVKIGLLREPFLAHAGLLAVFSDRVAKDLEMWSAPGHKVLGKQDGKPRNTPNMGVFASAMSQAYGQNKRHHE